MTVLDDVTVLEDLMVLDNLLVTVRSSHDPQTSVTEWDGCNR